MSCSVSALKVTNVFSVIWKNRQRQHAELFRLLISIWNACTSAEGAVLSAEGPESPSTDQELWGSLHGGGSRQHKTKTSHPCIASVPRKGAAVQRGSKNYILHTPVISVSSISQTPRSAQAETQNSLGPFQTRTSVQLGVVLKWSHRSCRRTWKESGPSICSFPRNLLCLPGT